MAGSAQQLLALLIIKRSAVLHCVRWPGRWHTGLPRMSTGRSVWFQIVCWTGQHAPAMPLSASIVKEWKTQWCARRFSHAVWLVFSCNWWNWKRLNSVTWFATCTVHQYTCIFVYRARRLYTLHVKWMPCEFFQGTCCTLLFYSILFTMSAV